MTAETAVRDREVDAFRFAMVAAVVMLHSMPVNVPGRPPLPLPAWSPPVDAFCRAAVPFFLVVSGHYARSDPVSARTVLQPLRRVLPVYAIWLAIYLVASRMLGMAWQPSWTAIYDGGPAFHLWFLPSLALSLVVVSTARRLLGPLATLGLVALLALAGPIAFAHHRLIGVDQYPWRLVPLVRQLGAPIFVWIGMQLKHVDRPSPRTAMAMIAIGYAALLAEGLTLSRSLEAYVSYDILLGTLLLGPALFLLARSLRSRNWPDWIVRAGRLSLGIYVSHLLFIWAIRRLIPAVPAPLLAATALGLATTLSLILSRNGVLRRLVM